MSCHPTGVRNKQFSQVIPPTKPTPAIGVRKAYIHAFFQITKIPVFREFEIWKQSNFETHDYSMLRSREKALIFNKTHCLVCRKFLRHYAGKCAILYYQETPRVYKVNYTKLIKQLWATKRSDNYPQDINISKNS